MNGWINEWMMDAEQYDLLKENTLNSAFSNVFMIRYNSR